MYLYISYVKNLSWISVHYNAKTISNERNWQTGGSTAVLHQSLLHRSRMDVEAERTERGYYDEARTACTPPKLAIPSLDHSDSLEGGEDDGNFSDSDDSWASDSIKCQRKEQTQCNILFHSWSTQY